MVLLDNEELIRRNDARKRLGLGLEEKVVYVQLGAGRINEIGSEVRLTIDAFAHENVSVVLGESMLGERLSVNLDRVVLLLDYPTPVYFNAFDASVQAGGYNSYHEMRKFASSYRVLPKHGDRDGRPNCPSNAKRKRKDGGWWLRSAPNPQSKPLSLNCCPGHATQFLSRKTVPAFCRRYFQNGWTHERRMDASQ